MADVTLVQVRFQDHERDALDRYRRQQVNPPSRPQAIRELLKNVLRKQPASSAGEARA
jgi:hypothetical protein